MPAAIALSVGVAALVIRRLVLMRRHQRAALDAAGDGASVITSGVFLLTLEASAIVWVVGGWSSLVGLRFRCGLKSSRDLLRPVVTVLGAPEVGSGKGRNAAGPR